MSKARHLRLFHGIAWSSQRAKYHYTVPRYRAACRIDSAGNELSLYLLLPYRYAGGYFKRWRARASLSIASDANRPHIACAVLHKGQLGLSLCRRAIAIVVVLLFRQVFIIDALMYQ